MLTYGGRVALSVERFVFLHRRQETRPDSASQNNDGWKGGSSTFNVQCSVFDVLGHSRPLLRRRINRQAEGN